MDGDDNFQNSIMDINDGNEDINDGNQLKNAIATWVVTYNVPHNACNTLLQILRQYALCDLPRDEHYCKLRNKLILFQYVEENISILVCVIL